MLFNLILEIECFDIIYICWHDFNHCLRNSTYSKWFIIINSNKRNV